MAARTMKTYATFDLAQRRVAILKQHGLWPGIRACDGQYVLTLDPDDIWYGPR